MLHYFPYSNYSFPVDRFPSSVFSSARKRKTSKVSSGIFQPDPTTESMPVSKKAKITPVREEIISIGQLEILGQKDEKLKLMHKSLLIHKRLAHIWSVTGLINIQTNSYFFHGKLTGIETDGRNPNDISNRLFLKNVYFSWKQFTKKKKIKLYNNNILKALKIFKLDISEQQKEISLLIKNNRLWIKPIIIGRESRLHFMTLIGSSQLTILFNRSPITWTQVDAPFIPAGMLIFTPSIKYSITKLSQLETAHASINNLFNQIRDCGLTHLGTIELSPQKAQNCCFVNAKGALLASLIIEKAEKVSTAIREDTIVRIHEEITPLFKDWSTFHRWKSFKKDKHFAALRLVEAIESKAAVKFINLILKTNQCLWEKDPSVKKTCANFLPFNSKEWRTLSEEHKQLYISIDKNGERQKLIQQFFRLNIPWLKEPLTTFIHSKALTTLIEYLTD